MLTIMLTLVYFGDTDFYKQVPLQHAREITDEQKPTGCHLLFYFMFRVLLCPSSGARDYNNDYHNGHFVLICCRLEVRCD